MNFSSSSFAALVLSAGAFGCICGGPGPSPAGDGGTSLTGIYRQSTTTISDTCSPRACEGDAGLVAVTSTGEAAIRIPVVDCFGGQRVFGTQYQDAPSDYAVTNSCGEVIGKQTVSIEQVGPPIILRASTRLDAGECARDGGLAVMRQWPAAACSFEQRLKFELVQDCQPPCALMTSFGAPLDGGETINCKCP
ncbi:MAG: hypothetical protein Q8N26_02715 [Myxococcales bacterium]|nr:hypothetical protein [Myxococcales bacterium]